MGRSGSHNQANKAPSTLCKTKANPRETPVQRLPAGVPSSAGNGGGSPAPTAVLALQNESPAPQWPDPVGRSKLPDSDRLRGTEKFVRVILAHSSRRSPVAERRTSASLVEGMGSLFFQGGGHGLEIGFIDKDPAIAGVVGAEGQQESSALPVAIRPTKHIRGKKTKTLAARSDQYIPPCNTPARRTRSGMGSRIRRFHSCQ